MKKIAALCMSLFIMMGMAGCVSDSVDPSTLKTPQYTVDSGAAPSFAPGENEVHTAEDGIKVIPLPTDSSTEETAKEYETVTKVLSSMVTPENVWETDTVATYNAFTLPEKVTLDDANGSLGVLSIPALGVTANVFETADEMEAMSHGVAHFRSTSAWDGTVGLVKSISENDWSYLDRSAENKLTLITCISGKPPKDWSCRRRKYSFLAPCSLDKGI